MSLPTLNVAQTLTGKRVLFVGATGFLGKVSLSMLMHRYGEALGKVFVLMRKGSAASAERRFFDKVAPSEPFEPLRQKYGGEAQALCFLQKKISVLDGDLKEPGLGLSEATVQMLQGRVDVLVNCAGLVSFNPSLEMSLEINTFGVRHAVELCQKLGIPIVHVSTAFVAGNRSGLVFEDEEVVGYFPRRGELDARDFSLEQELADAEKLVARLREMAEDKTISSRFRQSALERLSSEGRDTSDEKALRLAVGRERRLWLSMELVKAGMERAAHWGWPNTYTYSKSLGEQVIAQTPGLSYAIVRPSIVESALHYPLPGWNEGFTTSAPLAFAGIKGHRNLPAGEKTILDVIPVDLVAGALIGITAHLLSPEGKNERKVFHLASGDQNPFFASRSVELVGLYRRRHYRNKSKGNRFFNALLSRVEPLPVTPQRYRAVSAPFFEKGARLLKDVLQEVRPSWGAPKLQALLDEAQDRLSQVEAQAQSVDNLVQLFLPFLWENRYVFRCDNTRTVYGRMAPQDAALIPWNPEALDWRTYFLEVHLPGLEKWVFPGLEEERQKKRVVPAHRDLLELFDAAVSAHRHRVAFRFVHTEREERFTYGEVHRYANRVGSFLLKAGVQRGDRVLLISESRPEWGMTFFGILRAGATAVPVDPDLSEAEVVNLARRSEAKVCLLSEESAQSLPGLFRSLAEAGLSTLVHSLAQAMEGDPLSPHRIGAVRKSASSDEVASLIFTSGTTGTPKGVMLTHRNFASLVAKLAGIFHLGPQDGLLSVLPLHHTFEFSAGFLTPLSCGAEITYLDELTADRLGEVLETGRITAMIGVPALWQLLHRSITQELAAAPTLVEQTVRGLMSAHGELRSRSRWNVGKLLFWPVHRKLGGRLRYLVSGGSALSQEVQKAFFDLGFQITQGYGLTEAAPVLTVSEASNQKPNGSVGAPLPGVELRIEHPDGEGVGEVWAKGPNVMAGYFKDADATQDVLQDGWLRTGDLGKLDDKGNLQIVGRVKDVIIDANGKNVYPDELEELFGQHPHIQELSVVGLPDSSGGEKVACLCVPDYRGRPRDEVRRELEAHFKETSAELPFYRRVKVLRLWDGELPRTSTRKVQRKNVVAELLRLEQLASSAEKAKEKASVGTPGGILDWLRPLMAELLQKPLDQIRPEARLSADLGIDSLLLTELSVALEGVGVPLHAIEDLSSLETVEDVRRAIAASGRRLSGVTTSEKRQQHQEEEIAVPPAMSKLGRALLGAGQRLLYESIYHVKVSGRSFIPQNQNVLVVANHASHLDMGLVKVVLGEQGERLSALAARDYFFDTPLKRAYFENFTNLIPMDRHGSLRESLRLAGEALSQGYHLLLFPEGTRSTEGQLLEFKPTLGYLALTHQVDVLPLYLKGTNQALPKGAVLPKMCDLEVRIGPLIKWEDLKMRCRDLPRSESYRAATRWVEEVVRNLRDGEITSFDRLDPLRPEQLEWPRKIRGGGEA